MFIQAVKIDQNVIYAQDAQKDLHLIDKNVLQEWNFEFQVKNSFDVRYAKTRLDISDKKTYLKFKTSS